MAEGNTSIELRRTGIDIIGDVSWGTHFCQFYQSKQDLIDILTPYFKAGLESNEFCMWITAEPLDRQEAEAALRAVVPDLDRYLKAGQIEIIPHTEWYLKAGALDLQRVLTGWVDKLNNALARGYEGLRATGNTFWLEKSDWEDFTAYEAAVNSVIGQYRMIAICTYWLPKWGASEIADVISNHQFALMRRDREWSIIESSDYKETKEALRAALRELDTRKAELEAANEELRASNVGLQSEIVEHKRDEAALEETSRYLESLINYAKSPIIVWDSDFRITRFNRAFERLTAYTSDEVVGQELRMLFPEDTREESLGKIERTLSGEFWESVEIPILRKNGEVRIALWNSANIHADDGRTIAATIAQGQDITERKRAEDELGRARADAERYAAELHSFVSSMADCVILFDAVGNVTFVNDAGKELLGLRPGETFANWLTQYRTYSLDGSPVPTDRAPMYQALHGKTVRDMCVKMVTPDGKELVLGVSAAPVRDSLGRIIGATGVFRDVAERVEFERRQEELYDREHHIAEVLQQALIPPNITCEVPGYRVAVRYQPALKEAEVGGDFYDIFELGAGKFGILVGDVAGKGLLAAMRVAAARHTIRSYAFLHASPGKALTLANQALSRDDIESGGMVSAFFAIVDVHTHTITYANGGHEPPVLRDRRGKTEELAVTGSVLGVTGELTYSESTRRLQPGDAIVTVTDGITEARAGSTSLFGKDAIKRYLEKSGPVSPDEIASDLLAAALAHAGGSLQDDAAIVVLEREHGDIE